MATRHATPAHLEIGDDIRNGAVAPLTDRVNVEPPILNGMTTTEASYIAAVSFTVFIALGGLLVAITGLWQCLLVVGLFCPLAVLWWASKYLARIKRNRPDAYYAQAMHFWASGKGLSKSKFILHNGYWSLGKTMDGNFSSPFHVTQEEKHSPQKKSRK